jgi:hypothetical protein
VLGTLAGTSVASGCARAPAPRQLVPAAPSGQPSARLFLIGDAGGPEKNPVLTALRRELARDGAHSVVLFLGDNVYPNGLPDSAARDYPEAAGRLRGQAQTVREAGARAIFLAGNHDWGPHRVSGDFALGRQAAYLRRLGATEVVQLPEAGCPGPSVVDIGLGLRLILLDTEWWLRRAAERARRQPAGCPGSEATVLTALRNALSAAGTRRVVVAGHHPLASGGPHGGRFGWRDHLFPLREDGSGLWVPLPIFGSAYVIARQAGASSQDLSSRPYRRLRGALEAAFAEHRPFIYAAGHEHNLQVLRGSSARYLLVSGSGTYGQPSRVMEGRRTEFARAASGFMRLDFWESGVVLLSVVVVGGTGAASERFSMLLN